MKQPWRQPEQISGKIANVTMKEKKVLSIGFKHKYLALHVQSQIFMLNLMLYLCKSATECSAEISRHGSNSKFVQLSK